MNISVVKQCYNCQAKRKTLVYVDNDLYCDKCKAELAVECSKCETYTLNDNAQEQDDKKYCESCFDDKFISCDQCEEIKLNDGSEYVNDENICEDCISGHYFHCNDCGNTTHNDNSVNTQNGNSICEDCYSNDYFSCYSCGEVYHDDDSNYCDSCENDFCEDCYSDSEHSCHNGGDSIDNSIKFLEGKKCKDMPFKNFVGVEIEHITPNSVDFGDISDIANVGGDGSIDTDDNNGYSYEVKTMPASGDKLIEVINRTTDFLKQNQAKVNKSCGLHIHIDSRNIYDKPILLSRAFKTYYAFEDCLYLMLPVSRVNNSYCRPLASSYEKPISAKDKGKLLAQWNGRSTHEQSKGSRYHSFNVAALSSHHTIELRLHSGTVDSVKILNWIKINLYMFAYMHNYNAKTIQEATKMGLSKKKIDLFFKTVKLPKELQRYYWSRVLKFNPNFKNNKYHVKMKFKVFSIQQEMSKIQTRVNNKVKILQDRDNNSHNSSSYYQNKNIMPLIKKMEKLQKVENNLRDKLTADGFNQVEADSF
jgi:hypothetical protein